MRRRAVLTGVLGFAAGSSAAQDTAVSVRQLQFESRGRQIRAASYAPADGPPNGGLVFMHGAGGVGPLQLDFARRFAARQRALVIVPAYADAGADDGVRRPRLMNAWRDCATDAVTWLIEAGVPASRTAICGYSLGAYIAVDSALGGGPARAAVGIAVGWDVYAPRPPRRRIPVLIVRPEEDEHVSPASTDRLVSYLRDANVAIRETRIPNAGHMLTGPQWDDTQARTARFLSDLSVFS